MGAGEGGEGLRRAREGEDGGSIMREEEGGDISGVRAIFMETGLCRVLRSGTR